MSRKSRLAENMKIRNGLTIKEKRYELQETDTRPSPLPPARDLLHKSTPWPQIKRVSSWQRRRMLKARLPLLRTSVLSDEDNTCRIWDLRKKKSLYIIPAHSNLISQVKFEPQEGYFLVTASYDMTAKVYFLK